MERKDERKWRKDGVTQSTQSSLSCPESGCAFVGQTKAGLVNHSRRKHSSETQSWLQCPHCGCYYKQGMVMHIRYCLSNPDQPKQVKR